jgi:hypothetical protein
MTLYYRVVVNPDDGFHVVCCAHTVAKDLKREEAEAIAKALNDTAQRAADTK